ncbi:MAG: BrnA antitoxin family protein [Pseudomonadota bacterium]
MAHKKSGSSAPVKRAAKKEAPTKKRSDKDIDFSDIPELTDAQLLSMRRVGRPPIGEQARQLIAIRVDPKILMLLQAQAKRQGKGYQTLINEILAEHVEEAV